MTLPSIIPIIAQIICVLNAVSLSLKLAAIATNVINDPAININGVGDMIIIGHEKPINAAENIHLYFGLKQ